MGELNGSIRIEAPVEQVFAFVDDWRNTTRFVRGLVGWEPVDPAKMQGLGTRFRAQIKVGPSTLEGEMEVVEHVPNERVAFRTTSGVVVQGQWMFHAEGDATVVELRNTYELPGGIAGKMVGKIAEGQGRKDLDGSLADLKGLIEGPEAQED